MSYRNYDATGGTDRQARQILESITDAFVSVDSNWRFTYVNQHAARLLGHGDLVGKDLWDMFPGLEGSYFEAVYRRVADQGIAESATAFYPDHDRWYEIHVYPASDGISIYFRNVTERKAAEDVLRRSDEKYRTLFNSIDEGFCVIEMLFDQNDRPVDYRFLEANPAFERHTGLVDAIGRTARVLVPELDESWYRIYGKVALTGESARFENYDPAMNRWFDVFAFRVGLPEERRVALIFNNVTERKEAEDALRNSEKRFRSTFENAAVGIAHVGVDGRWLRVNERLCEIVGYSKDEMLRMTFQDITHPEDLEPDLKLADRLLQGEIPNYQLEKRYLRKGGSSVWIHLTVSLVRDEEGNPGYFIAVIEDITERKNAAEALRRSERHLRELSRSLEERIAQRTIELQQQTARLRSLAAELASTEQRERKRLAAVLHDDLQQLLVAAKIHLLESRRHIDTEASAEALDEAVQRISEAVAAARDLTRQLRPPTLYEAGLVSALNWLSSEMAERHRLRVTVNADRDGPTLTDDIKAFLFDCTRELLFNVVKYAGVDEAMVEVRQDEESLRLIVVDEGRGFDADSISKGRQTGGFGLFSVRERLAALGGSMAVDSGPEKGTRIQLAVPLASAIAEDAPEDADPSLSRVTGGDGAGEIRTSDADLIRVVVVDDHAMVREGLANILRMDKRLAVVGEAADGIEAIEMLKRERPEIVLLDLNMPRMNGVEAAREIRRRWPDTLVIGISVQGDKTTARSMLDAGAAAFLSKSGDSDQMIKTIVDLVERRRPTEDGASDVSVHPANRPV